MPYQTQISAKLPDTGPKPETCCRSLMQTCKRKLDACWHLASLRRVDWQRLGKPPLSVSAVLVAMLCSTSVMGQETGKRQVGVGGPNEPVNRLNEIQRNKANREFIFSSQPLADARDLLDSHQDALYDATGLRLGFALTHVFQAATGTIGDTDDVGTTGTGVLVGQWDLLFRDTPYLGQFVFGIEGRWNYGTTGPEAIGFQSIGSSIGTADTFDRYVPAVIPREYFWRMGSEEAGWAYRVGKITPDGLFATSEYFDPTTAFLPTGSVGANTIAFPDSGLGFATVLYPHDRFRILGAISDANADRFEDFDLSEVDGETFKALELQAQIVPPKSSDTGYSTFTLWHTDGTSDGQAKNGNTGRPGWGFFIKHEQEFGVDGKNVGILRYGKGFNNAAILYDQQASIHYVRKDPPDPFGISTDLLGVALNWTDPTADVRDEYDFEIFYRVPLLPTVDASLAYQAIINPAFNAEHDFANVFSFRLRKTF